MHSIDVEGRQHQEVQLAHRHVTRFTEIQFTYKYVRIKSTLQFHDVELKAKYMYVVKSAVTQAETKSWPARKRHRSCLATSFVHNRLNLRHLRLGEVPVKMLPATQIHHKTMN